MLDKNENKSITYIQNTKYSFIILKINYNWKKSIQKLGFSIHKKTLDINEIKEDTIDLLINTNNNLIEAKANIGFINLANNLCYLYATNNDVIEKEKIEGRQKLKIYKIKNIQYISLAINLSQTHQKIMNTEFNKIKNFLISERLFFCEIPFRYDLDLKSQIENFQSNDVKYKLFENFQYNHNFSPNICEKILTPIVKGSFKNILIHEGNIHLIMRYKIYDNYKYLIEIETFIPSCQNNKKSFQNIFYAYFNESEDKIKVLENIINNWNQNLSSFQVKNTEENKCLIINFDNDKEHLILKEIQKLPNLEIFNLNKTNSIDKVLSQCVELFKTIGYNYNFHKIEYNSQNRLLILISNDFENLLQMIKAVSSILFSIFLQDRNTKSNIIDDVKEKIQKHFKKLEKDLKQFEKEYPNRMQINIINNKNFDMVKKSILKDQINIFSYFDINQTKEENKIEINDNNNSITLFIGTYNVNALESDMIRKANLSPLLSPAKLQKYFTDENYPVFYCLGLEETIELNPKNVLIKPKNKAEIWVERISSELQKKYNYLLICKEQLVGILLLFYVKASEMNYIKNIQTEKLKSGFMGCGNKGCCFLDFEYKGKSYGFCSCHLPAGQKEKNLISRKDTFNNILNFNVGKSQKNFKKNDYFFIFGDLNFRTIRIGLISLKNHIKILSADKKAMEDKKRMSRNSLMDFGLNEKTKHKILKRLKTEVNFENSINNNNSKINKKLSKKDSNDFFINQIQDEFKEDNMEESIFTKYFLDEFLGFEELKKFEETELSQFNIIEEEIKFPPTYKYKKYTNNYNISKKVPSWTDRILYKKNENIVPILYDRVDLNYSDHKPIIGFFEIFKNK